MAAATEAQEDRAITLNNSLLLTSSVVTRMNISMLKNLLEKDLLAEIQEDISDLEEKDGS